ncbi:exonuclease SbcC [Ornithinimicrobium faecis]|uniref:Exonuclease SbcC n=1 Tax=Ornithinimicrobium faecis TaxID=2934158 RepID=A0ABY4YU96_9MICO|nr:exonuclease SbcC [Ornithinimicrobium sp. HY1793]USQ80332.1 exonuclease SbcC [Ornithinimicrobium sp. HY1793]
MSTSTGDFALSTDELRVVVGFALASAEEVLEIFETAQPDDARPRAAIDAARSFAEGAPRSNLQRTTSTDAHRAAREVIDAAAAHAARAAGDAAAAAYLHPLAQATQVGHILRASAHAARALELNAGGSAQVGDDAIGRARQRATSALVAVLLRYPLAPTGRTRVAELMSALHASLRATSDVQREDERLWQARVGDLIEFTRDDIRADLFGDG